MLNPYVFLVFTMRVCLVTPALISSSPYEPMAMPMGIGYLGAVLERAGFEVTLVDGVIEGPVVQVAPGRYRIGLDPDSLAQAVADSKPALIGLSCPFTSRYSLFRQSLRAIRKLLPKKPVVVGGIHPTLFYQQVLEQDKPEVVVLGEGEMTLLELVKRAADKGFPDPEGLDGVAWLHNGQVQACRRTQYIENLDDLPEPARHLFPMEEYLKRSGGRWASFRKSAMSIMTSRSCPGRCSFCSIHTVFGPKWRAHSPQRVLNELTGIVNKYNPYLVAIEDDRFTWDRSRLIVICQGIQDRNLRVRWHTPNGVHVADLDEEVLRIMKAAGCVALNLAIESGDPYILNEVMGKKATGEQARAVAEACRKLGIRMNAYFVIGMPGETDETVQHSLDLCLQLPLDGLDVFIATPFPGTRLFKQCVEKGYIEGDTVLKSLSEGDDPRVFLLPSYDTDTMSRERLLWWQRKFYGEFLKNLYRRKPLLRFRKASRFVYHKARSVVS
jgi:anaerobic magnesium-protoporphyrin IX monomethyl ester cyclase